MNDQDIEILDRDKYSFEPKKFVFDTIMKLICSAVNSRDEIGKEFLRKHNQFLLHDKDQFYWLILFVPKNKSIWKLSILGNFKSYLTLDP